jgi:hypothetical protein
MTTASTVGDKDVLGIDEANVTISHFVQCLVPSAT